MQQPYTANGIIYDTKNEPQYALDLVIGASYRLDKNKLECGTRFSIVRRQRRLNFTATRKLNYFVHGLEPSICKEM